MSKPPHFARDKARWIGSLPHRLSVFFAANLDEALTVADIAIKFGVGTHDVQSRLSAGVKCGLFARANNRGPGRVSYSVVVQPTTYSAGPMLLQMAGGAKSRAEAAEAMLALTGEPFAEMERG